MLSLSDESGVVRSFSPGDLLQEGTICALCDARGHSGDGREEALGLLMLGDGRGCPSPLGSMGLTVMWWEDIAGF